MKASVQGTASGPPAPRVGRRPEEAINRNLKPGEEYQVRRVFVAPENVGLRQFTVREGNGHGVVCDVSSVK